MDGAGEVQIRWMVLNVDKIEVCEADKHPQRVAVSSPWSKSFGDEVVLVDLNPLARSASLGRG